MLSQLIVTIFFLATTVSTTVAAEVPLGDVSINLPPPKGFCELTAVDPSDQRMISTLTGLLAKSGNKLLSMSADCQQLSDWRAGKRPMLDDYAQYQTPIALIDKPPSEPVAQTCATLREQGNQILANQLADIKARVESTLSGIKMNETSFIGVLEEDSNVCYAGLIQKIKTDASTDRTQVTIFAITIVKDRSIFIYRFSVYKSSDTVTEVLSNLKVDVAALNVAQPP